MFLILLSLISIVAGQDSNSCSINNLKTSYPAPATADGWAFRLVASDLSRPRSILFDTNGALLVVEQRKGIVHLEFEDQGETCLTVRKQTTILENDELTHGIGLSEDGRTLYASTVDEVYSWPYDPSGPSIATSSRRTLVTNMGNPGSHSTRTILFSKKNPGMLLVSRGSGENEDAAALERSTGISQIRVFNITALGDDGSPYNYTRGDLLGWGLRNSVGIGEHPDTGGIWSVENSVDNLSRRGRDIHADNPGEELNFHGYLNGSDENRGANYGYPFCYALWSTEDFPELNNLTVGDQFQADWETDDEDTTLPNDNACNTEYVAPALPFQAHTAPLDIKFNGNGTRAYVSFHGSWNRDDPAGYKISYIPFDQSNGQPSVSKTNKDATIPIIYNKDLSNCPDDCFRPVGLAWDSKGRLWFSSDSTGEIFVLNHDGKNRTDGNNPSDNDGDGDNAASGLMRPELKIMALTMGAILVVVFA